MKPDFVFILLVFYALLFATLISKSKRQTLFKRTKSEWLLDIAGLCIHGAVVPLFQIFVIFQSLTYLFPQAAGSLELSSLVSFAIAFLGVDYLYYWNHRILHNLTLWRFHSVHHSSQALDVFATSRNSFITSFLIVYVWLNGLMLFLLADKEAYIWGVALTNALDILRHSGFSRWPTWLSIVTSPRDHAWHHSTDTYGINFGGNLTLWDRLHRTYHPNTEMPPQCGFDMKKQNLWHAFLKGFT